MFIHTATCFLYLIIGEYSLESDKKKSRALNKQIAQTPQFLPPSLSLNSSLGVYRLLFVSLSLVSEPVVFFQLLFLFIFADLF